MAPRKPKRPPAKAAAKPKAKARAKPAAKAPKKPPKKPPKSKADARKPPRPKGSTRKRKSTRKRPPSGAMYLRDTLILQRRAQDWTWEAIAAEAGLSVRAAQEAAERRRAELPLALKADPLSVVDDIMLGFQTSIGDFEALAVRYQEQHPSAAVGAKRAANDARNSVLVLLQATGRLPEDLATLRQLIEQRAVATTMVDSMERFAERVAEIEMPEELREPLLAAVGEVQATFSDLIGLREGLDLNDRGLPAGSEDPDVIVSDG